MVSERKECTEEEETVDVSSINVKKKECLEGEEDNYIAHLY
jgi:hypothetical protein